MNHDSRANEIAEMVAGSLDRNETEALLDHISTCDICLAEADRRWSTATLIEVPSPDAPRMRSLERRLMDRLSRSDFGGQVVQLGTIGLSLVFLSLLEPFVGLGESGSIDGDDET